MRSIQEYRAIAERATPGNWHSMTEETGDRENIYYVVERFVKGKGCVHMLEMTATDQQARADADHVAMFNRDTMLEILDELEKYQKTSKITQERMGKIRAFAETFEAVPELPVHTNASEDQIYDSAYAKGHNDALTALKGVLSS